MRMGNLYSVYDYLKWLVADYLKNIRVQRQLRECEERAHANWCSGIRYAVSKNYLDVVKIYHERNDHWEMNLPDCNILMFSCTRDHKELIEWMVNEGYPQTEDTIDLVACDGDLEMIEWLFEKGFKYSALAFIHAAERGNFEVLKWLHNNRELGISERSKDPEWNGSCGTQWESNRQLLNNYYSRVFNLTACKGNIEMLEWLNHRGYKGTVSAMDYSACNGHIETLKWLHKNEYECTSDAMDGAAESGHYDTVRWLYYNTTKGCTYKGIGSTDPLYVFHKGKEEEYKKIRTFLVDKYGETGHGLYGDPNV